ncbi:ECF transporter S component [Homoserinibacter sp. YIM 151385]|uniref:ECF transporter S component n=1 Tax=Homoserinibacter sp. YIM 151385 TaxID=2985506 RepID=UPI0022F03216|nr:ECF transporter S component [Homoserinibacter sp. YIM 151385]WBU37527.1 ECF transporter S component [Homoserinibacter sp. YIM 151385]
MTERRRAARSSTRDLLVVAAIGAFGAVLLILLVPVTTPLAIVAPPAYALVVAVPATAIMIARRLVPRRLAASGAALVMSVLLSVFTPIGILAAIPLLAQGIAIDAMVAALRSRPSRWLWAGLVAGAVAFAIALPVFGPHHLTAGWLLATAAARLVGGAFQAWLSGALARQMPGRLAAP